MEHDSWISQRAHDRSGLQTEKQRKIKNESSLRSAFFSLPELLTDQLGESEIQESLQIKANPRAETQMPNWHRHDFKGITRVFEPMDSETRESRVNG
jgi:hypothetical protein